MMGGIAQLAFFVAWLVVLYSYRPLRDLVIRAPRLLSIPVALLTAAWTVAHLADSRTRFVPLIGVYMYGDFTPGTSVSGVATWGRWCEGTRGTERINLGFLGRVRPRLRLQSEYLGLRRASTAADSAESWALINGTLRSIGRLYNEAHPGQPLCAIGLDELHVPIDQYVSGTLPPRRVVHEIPLR